MEFKLFNPNILVRISLAIIEIPPSMVVKPSKALRVISASLSLISKYPPMEFKLFNPNMLVKASLLPM